MFHSSKETVQETSHVAVINQSSMCKGKYPTLTQPQHFVTKGIFLLISMLQFLYYWVYKRNPQKYLQKKTKGAMGHSYFVSNTYLLSMKISALKAVIILPLMLTQVVEE